MHPQHGARAYLEVELVVVQKAAAMMPAEAVALVGVLACRDISAPPLSYGLNGV